MVVKPKTRTAGACAEENVHISPGIFLREAPFCAFIHRFTDINTPPLFPPPLPPLPSGEGEGLQRVHGRRRPGEGEGHVPVGGMVVAAGTHEIMRYQYSVSHAMVNYPRIGCVGGFAGRWGGGFADGVA